MAREFEFYTAGRVILAGGALDRLADISAELGSRALLVVGKRFARDSGLVARLEAMITVAAVASCEREPHIEDVDAAVASARAGGCDMVVAVGGGAVLDCGKAAAGMMTNDGSLADYLEGVGTGRQISRRAAPMIAVPTTSGTGSEVTKNAVISGPGYKKSVRSPLLIPAVALVDPELTHSLSPPLTAACGMDALTQVIEPYLSKNASPVSDGLARVGIAAAGRGLARAFDHPEDGEARAEMALASVLGGICLANAGLGAVHGFAAPLGADFAIAHGVACATMLVPAIAGNLAATRGSPVEGRFWGRFAEVAELLTGNSFADPDVAVAAGLTWLRELTDQLAIPRLGELGVSSADLAGIVAGSRGSSMAYNAVDLSDEQLSAMLEAAL